MSNHSKKLQLKVNGTHCASCEVLIERSLMKLPGVEKVHVNFANGKTDVFTSRTIELSEIGRAIQDGGYSVSRWDDRHTSRVSDSQEHGPRKYVEIGAIFLLLFGAYLMLKQFDLVPAGLGVTDTMSYGFVFLIGLVAALSTCLAVAGGLLLAAAAKYNDLYPNLTGYQKFKPTLYFNIGRVVSYTVFGGLIGALGSVISLSSRGTGILTIVASLVMIILGFQLLHLFPWMKRFQPRMPKFLSHKIHELSGKDGKAGAFTLGALTFFLPCGFTQALQLYVLAQGSASVGALTMFAFSLGTLPMLLSLSAVSSFAKGSFQKHFIRVSAVLVVMLGFWNVNNGLALAGVDLNIVPFTSNERGAQAFAPIVDGKQVVEMTVNGYTYTPSRFTVRQGVPVEWKIDARNAAGCAQVITIPSLGVTKYLSTRGITTITFTPTESGTLPFMCTMAMTTPGAAFTVVPGPGTGVVSAGEENTGNDSALSPQCNPKIMNCIPAQKLNMEISAERGFYPDVFSVKKGIPVKLEIEAKIVPGGCASVLIIPQYDQALTIKKGSNTLAFTPKEEGVLYATCSMGSRMIQFNVTS